MSSKFREALRRRRAQEAAKRARAQIPLARSLEKMGKITGALEFYQTIARDANGTKEGKLAELRISELSKRERISLRGARGEGGRRRAEDEGGSTEEREGVLITFFQTSYRPFLRTCCHIS